MPPSGSEVEGQHLTWLLGGAGRARDLPSNLESLHHWLTILRSKESVASQPGVLADRTICREKTLRVSWGLEALHAPLALKDGLEGIFGMVVRIAVLATFHTREVLPLCNPVTGELIGDGQVWDVLATFEELVQELFRCDLVAPALDKDI